MKTSPILFSAPMVLALLDGSKTQTRRVITPQPSSPAPAQATLMDNEEPVYWAWGHDHIICPFGLPSDRLWVRETWKRNTNFAGEKVTYRADHSTRQVPEKALPIVSGKDVGIEDDNNWRPSIFMPRWACRLVLEVADIRAQRLQDISEADAEAEGVAFMREIPDADETLTARQLYKILWDSLNEKRGFGWATNPWVWAITFKRT